MEAADGICIEMFETAHCLPSHSQHVADVLLPWNALLVSIPGMLCSNVIDAVGCLRKPLQIPVKAVRPLVQPEEVYPDTCTSQRGVETAQPDTPEEP